MKSPRSSKSRRRRSSSSNGIHNNTNHRRSQRNRFLTLDVAKGIVKEACIAAVAYDKMGDREFDTIDMDGSSSGDENDVATEFAMFVSSTISRATASLLAEIHSKTQRETQTSKDDKATTKAPRKKRRVGRPRKRPRPLESKVQGLEHAESLHTMCSLFPVVMASVESHVHPRPCSDHGVRGDFTVHGGGADVVSVVCVEGTETDPSSLSSPNNSNSDHDSLLPPVGGPSAANTPTRSTDARTAAFQEGLDVVTVSTKDIPSIPTKPGTSTTTNATPIVQHVPPPVITTNNKNLILSKPSRSNSPVTTAKNNNNNNNNHMTLDSATSALLTLAHTPPSRFRSQSHSSFSLSHSVSNNSTNTNNEDDDVDYRPLIGVVGDEGGGTGIEVSDGSSNGYHQDRYGNNNSPDAIIMLKKVGSIVVQNRPALDTGKR